MMFNFGKKRKEEKLQESRKIIISLIDNDLRQALFNRGCDRSETIKISESLRYISFTQESADFLIQTIKETLTNINVATDESVKKVSGNELKLLSQLVNSLKSNVEIAKVIKDTQNERTIVNEKKQQLESNASIQVEIKDILENISECEQQQDDLVKKSVHATEAQKSVYRTLYLNLCAEIEECLQDLDIYKKGLSNNAQSKALFNRINAYNKEKRFRIVEPSSFDARMKEFESKREELDNTTEDIKLMLNNSAFNERAEDNTNTVFDARVENEKSKNESENFRRVTESVLGKEVSEEKQ